jgi:hypothetical protein
MITWFCQSCLRDFEGDVFEHWIRETGRVLCDECKKKED